MYDEVAATDYPHLAIGYIDANGNAVVLPDYAPPSESSTPGKVTDSFGNTVDITGDSDDYASLIRSNIQAASAAKAAVGGASVNVYGEPGRGYLPPTTSSSDNDNDRGTFSWGSSGGPGGGHDSSSFSYSTPSSYTSSRVSDFSSTGDWSRGFAYGGRVGLLTKRRGKR